MVQRSKKKPNWKLETLRNDNTDKHVGRGHSVFQKNLVSECVSPEQQETLTSVGQSWTWEAGGRRARQQRIRRTQRVSAQELVLPKGPAPTSLSTGRGAGTAPEKHRMEAVLALSCTQVSTQVSSPDCGGQELRLGR